MRFTWRPWLAPLLVVALAAAACGGDDGETADADGSTSSVATSPSTSSTDSVVASTLSTTTSTTTQTTAPTTASPTSTTSSTTAASSSTTTVPTTIEVLVIDGGGYEFTSPSGNIACVMSEAAASCWISEKSWTIEQPDGPSCDVSDWGNAVDLDVDGPYFGCYTDMAWNPLAPALPYGNAVEVGPFRCLSAEDGVTCSNAADRGFTVARAGVRLF